MIRFVMFCLMAGSVIFLTVYLISQPLWPDQTKEKNEISQRSENIQPREQSLSGGPALEAGLNPGVIIRDCRLACVNKEDVPTQRDGTLVIAGVEINPGFDGKPPLSFDAMVEWEDIYIAADGAKGVPMRPLRTGEDFDPEKTDFTIQRSRRYFNRLNQADKVSKNQVVAMMDPKLAIAQMNIRSAKLLRAIADRDVAIKTAGEADLRLRSAERLKQSGSISDEEYRTAKLGVDRYYSEFKSKKEQVNESKTDLLAARTELNMHEVRTAMAGTVRTINKQPGEASKSGETILDIQDLERLRVEGFVEVQNAANLQVGNRVEIEPTRPISPALVLSGHLLDLTTVAISRFPNSKPVESRSILASSSEDKTIRLWEVNQTRQGIRSAWVGRQLDVRRFTDPIRSLALSPILSVGGVEGFWLVGGDSTGYLHFLWVIADPKIGVKVEKVADIPAHKNAILSLAFSADGRLLATVGQDSAIGLWQIDRQPSEPILRIFKKEAHKGEISHVAFGGSRDPQSVLRLITACNDKDRSMGVWEVGGTPTIPTLDLKFDLIRRGGEVAQPGISSDGTMVLIDQGNDIKMVSLADRQPRGIIKNLAGGLNFTTMALFSPDSEMILTNCAEENRVQLWRSPTKGGRAAELRQLVWAGDGVATCGSFDPQRKFVVTGSADHQLLLWELPDSGEVNTILTGRIELISPFIDSSTPQRLFRARLDEINPGYLLPGGTATIVRPQLQEKDPVPVVIPEPASR